MRLPLPLRKAWYRFELRLIGWWWRRRQRWRYLAWPLQFLYGLAVSFRWQLYRLGFLAPRSLEAFVISVGNITVGGTGKTPMVLWLATRLLSEGKQVGILTRGYGRSVTEEKPSLRAEVRADEEDYAPHWGSDEVWLYRKRLGDVVRLGVGTDRYHWGRQFQRHGVQWLILDDGFQHLQLARDVDIVLIDATDPFGRGELLPMGRLREPLSALARADLLVISRSLQAPALESILGRYSSAPIFHAMTHLDSVFQFRPQFVGHQKPDWEHRKFFAFCGIGNPDAFFADLIAWGFTVVGRAVFPDHHVFSQKEVDGLEQQAKTAGAEGLICTEKDYLNLGGTDFRNVPVFYARIKLELMEGTRFREAIQAAIERKRAGKSGAGNSG